MAQTEPTDATITIIYGNYIHRPKATARQLNTVYEAAITVVTMPPKELSSSASIIADSFKK